MRCALSQNVVLAVLLLPLAPACSSTRDRDGAAGRADASRLGFPEGPDAATPSATDAGTAFPFPATDAASIDAGTPTRDAGGLERPPDAGPLPDDEPDVAPDERPSDDPASAGWMDPPSPAGACCEVGAVVGLDDVERQASPPVVAWDGSEWGVAWRVFESGTGVFRRLDAAATPTTGFRDLGLLYPAALAWGNGRFGLLGQYEAFLVLDREGAPRATAVIRGASDGGDVTRHAFVHGWAIATYADRDGGVSGDSRLVVLDETLSVSADRDLGVTRYADWRSLSVVSLGARLVVVQATGADVRFRTFAGRDADEIEGASFDPGRVTIDRHTDAAAALGASRFRDHVVAVVHGARSLVTAVFDPFAGEIVSGANEAVPSTHYRSPGVAADDVGGTVGICFPEATTTGDASDIRFVLLGPDGFPIGEPVTIASGLRYVAACSVAAASTDEFVVVWWNAARDEPRHSILAASVRARR